MFSVGQKVRVVSEGCCFSAGEEVYVIKVQEHGYVLGYTSEDVDCFEPHENLEPIYSPPNSPDLNSGVDVSAYVTEEGITMKQPTEDMVNSPTHYSAGMPAGVEVIDVIEAQGAGFHHSNVLKYVLRAQFKGNELQDYEKAAWYLNRKIASLKK